MKFFFNGEPITKTIAQAKFAQAGMDEGFDLDDVVCNWNNCLESEEMRDCYLPDGLEMVPA